MNHYTNFLQKLITIALPLLVLALVLGSRHRMAEAAAESASDTSATLVLASEIEWTPLNPARGDASPQAGTLWGDRAGEKQTGFLVKFADGFSSPPHIHNVTYRGVVLSGEVHNDDPDAEEMWMPSGSYWTQPAGEVHITSAKGEENIAYIEIENGPYLVWPPEQASDNGERPVNVHASNVMWLDTKNNTWIRTDEGQGAEIAFLWGKPEKGETNGTLLRLPAGFEGKIRSEDASFKAVVIQGQPTVQLSGEKKSELLSPGSYLISGGDVEHHISSGEDKASLLYLRTEGTFQVVPLGEEE
ncbi:MAG: DUF4437 domain-containing protein [Verrucomicrobiota bacterium]